MFGGAYTWRGLFSEFYGIAVYGYDPASYWVLSVSLKLAPVRLFSCRTISFAEFNCLLCTNTYDI